MIKRYIDAAFVLSLRNHVVDLFVFSFGRDLFQDRIRELYDKLSSEAVADGLADVELENPTGGERLSVSAAQLLFHSRVNALQLNLLSIPLHQRQVLTYQQFKELLRIETDIELEQIFTSMILQHVVKARMNAVERTICVTYVKSVSGNRKIKEVLIQRIDEWLGRVEQCRELLEGIMSDESAD